jgi:outer membrane lipoprotein-sorting protein
MDIEHLLLPFVNSNCTPDNLTEAKVVGPCFLRSLFHSAFSHLVFYRTHSDALGCLPRFVYFLFVLIACLPFSGCLHRSRPVPTRFSTAPLLTATSSDLIERVNAQVSKIQTLKATVKLTATVGGSRRGNIIEYREIRGYVLARRPSSLRIIGLLPVLQNRIFDMVSDGDLFKLSLPTKSQFIVGISQETKLSNPTLASLRPRVIFDALLLQAIDPTDVATVLEQENHSIVDSANGKTWLQPDYTLDIVRRNSHGWYLTRRISFNRADLQPYRQITYDEDGSISTDTHYDDYEDFSGCTFPTTIQIWRPQEEYSVRLRIVKLSLNESLSQDEFVLEPPPGVSVLSR